MIIDWISHLCPRIDNYCTVQVARTATRLVLLWGKDKEEESTFFALSRFVSEGASVSGVWEWNQSLRRQRYKENTSQGGEYHRVGSKMTSLPIVICFLFIFAFFSSSPPFSVWCATLTQRWSSCISQICLRHFVPVVHLDDPARILLFVYFAFTLAMAVEALSFSSLLLLSPSPLSCVCACEWNDIYS